MVICMERGADLHTAQVMPLPLTVSCFSKIQIGFTFLVLVHPGSPGQKAVKWVCVCIRSGRHNVSVWCLSLNGCVWCLSVCLSVCPIFPNIIVVEEQQMRRVD